MKVYYIKDDKCKDITNGVVATVGLVGVVVAGVTSMVVLQTASTALQGCCYDQLNKAYEAFKIIS